MTIKVKSKNNQYHGQKDKNSLQNTMRKTEDGATKTQQYMY